MSTWKPLGVFAVAVAIATPAFAEVPAKPTFTKDIAPIFQEKCEACHRVDQGARL
jgi:cytochrome c2